MQGLTEGRIVHYVLPDGDSEGEHRPAIVVKVWSQSDPGQPDYATVNLTVFTDHENDYKRHKPDVHQDSGYNNLFGTPSDGLMWATSVTFDNDKKEAGTWHWIEPAQSHGTQYLFS